MSHLTTSEGCRTVFEELYALIEINGFYFPCVHLSNVCSGHNRMARSDPTTESP